MVLVRFLKPWGDYRPGDSLFVPEPMAAGLERDGTATREGGERPAPPVERAVEKPANVRTADAPR